MECFERDKRGLMALLGEAAGKALERKATVDWAAYAIDVAKYLKEHANGQWRETFVPLIAGVIEDQAKHWETALGTRFDVRNLLAEQWFEDYRMKFADPITATSEEELSGLCQQAMREGWSLGEMRNRMGQMFRQWAQGGLSSEDFDWMQERMPPFRRDMISRTETMRAANTSTYQLMEEWGAPKLEWLATRDARCRPSHLAADGQVVETGKPFKVGGYKMLYPHDGSLGAPVSEIAECRCTTAPVIEEGQ